jgi:SsrA-binding protein
MARPGTKSTSSPPPKDAKRDPVAVGKHDAAQNRSASFHYHLTDKVEAGIALRGTEVKSVRAGQVQLREGYALVKDGEASLLGVHIGTYNHGSINNHEPLRSRRLLLHKLEIQKLQTKLQTKGITLIPTRMYFKGGKVKVEIAVAKGKQLWDKRETERRKTADNEAKQAIAASKKKFAG